MGTVTIKEGATLDVSGQLDEFGTPIGNGNSGTVFVRGGQLVMDASTIQAITWGAVDGAEYGRRHSGFSRRRADHWLHHLPRSRLDQEEGEMCNLPLPP